MPKPITPEIADLPKQDSIMACICRMSVNCPCEPSSTILQRAQEKDNKGNIQLRFPLIWTLNNAACPPEEVRLSVRPLRARMRRFVSNTTFTRLQTFPLNHALCKMWSCARAQKNIPL